MKKFVLSCIGSMMLRFLYWWGVLDWGYNSSMYLYIEMVVEEAASTRNSSVIIQAQILILFRIMSISV